MAIQARPESESIAIVIGLAPFSKLIVFVILFVLESKIRIWLVVDVIHRLSEGSTAMLDGSMVFGSWNNLSLPVTGS